MNYLTTFYKKKAEQLQEELNYLLFLLESSERFEDKFASMSDWEFKSYVEANPGAREKAEDLRRRGQERRRQSGQTSSENRTAEQSARDQAEREARRKAAEEAQQKAQERAQRQQAADEAERTRANSSEEQARQQRQAEEAARRRASAAPEPERATTSTVGAAKASEPFFSGKAFAKELTTFPTGEAIGRGLSEPISTAKSATQTAWQKVASAAEYAAKNPAKAAFDATKGAGKFALTGVAPIALGMLAGKAADTGMEAMGFKHSTPDATVKIGDEEVSVPFSDRPSARSVASSAADWAAMNAGFQVAGNIVTKAPVLAGVGSAGAAGLVAGAAAPAVAYGAYKVGEKIGEKTGFHDWLATKLVGSPNSPAPKSYPTVKELQDKQMDDIFKGDVDEILKRSGEHSSRYKARERYQDTLSPFKND
jgi:chemotaxis protein histidine kinase CheA